MTTEPTPLRVAKLEPNEDVVNTLKYWLSEARTGRIRGIILLGVTGKGTHIRSSQGEMGDASAVYLAQLVIHDGIESGKAREDGYDLPESNDDEDKPTNE